MDVVALQQAIALGKKLFPVLDGVSRTYVAPGGGGVVLLDMVWDNPIGYGLHLRTGPNTDGSGGGTAIIGLGTDQGSGTGLLISHKNTGEGFHLTGHPGSSVADHRSQYSSAHPMLIDVYAGAGPVSVHLQSGAGFNDGVTTRLSTTFTSASAAFTSADVGATLAQLTSRALSDPLGCIPSGATIVSVESATSVTMSAPAGATGSGILFSVGGRSPSDAQVMFEGQDTGGTVMWALRRTGFLQYPADVSKASMSVLGKVGATGAIFEVLQNVTGKPQMFWVPSTGGAIIKALAGQTTDLLGFQDTSGASLLRVGKAGRLITKVTGDPVLADLTDGEIALYTDGAGALKKAQRVGGVLTVRTIPDSGAAGTTLSASKITSISDGTTPTVAAQANAGTGATASIVWGNDKTGLILVTTGTTPAAGLQARVTWGTARSAATYNPNITPGIGATALKQPYAPYSALTTTTFDINLGATPVASTAYYYFYDVTDVG